MTFSYLREIKKLLYIFKMEIGLKIYAVQQKAYLSVMLFNTIYRSYCAFLFFKLMVDTKHGQLFLGFHLDTPEVNGIIM